MVCEVLEDDEGAGGFEEGGEVWLFDPVACGEEASVDGVACDVVEDLTGGGVDGDFLGDFGEEIGVGFDFGFGDEDGVEFVGGVDVMLED